MGLNKKPDRKDFFSRKVQKLDGPALRQYEDFSQILDILYQDIPDGDVPPRSNVLPAKLKPWLPNIFIWDVKCDDGGQLTDLVIRLEGTAVVEVYGEYTGRSWHDYPLEEVRERAFGAARQVLAQVRPFGYHIDGLTHERTYQAIRVMYIPLTTGAAILNQILGVIFRTRTNS